MQILFVHGTGVRRERHDAMLEKIRDALGARLTDVRLTSCFWGEDYGATLAFGGRSIPRAREVRAPGYDPLVADPQGVTTALWALLLADPLCELHVLARPGDNEASRGMPGLEGAGESVAERVKALASAPDPEGDLARLLDDTGLRDHYADALRNVAQSNDFLTACGKASDSGAAAEVAATAARAVVASMLSAAGEDALCNGDERNSIAEIITSRIGGGVRFPGAGAFAMLGRLALRVTTQQALNHWRTSMTAGATPALGDILRYQARGEPLREHLRERIAALGGPAVVIGHSLGGVALVDLLALCARTGRPLTNVALLITAGSQAAFLHEVGALTGVEPGHGLPPGFPAWLNIFDRQDLLAFLAEPVFGAGSDVTDFEVSSNQPFPICHGAYWKLPIVFDEIAKAVRAL